MVRTCFIGAPQCGHVGAVLSGLGMATKLFGWGRHQNSTRSYIHKVHAIACATGDALIGFRPVGWLEPMVDAQSARGAVIDNGDHLFILA